MTDRKTYLLDTNILLSDPDAIERFAGNDVYICLKVLEELDSKKKGSTALAHAARSVTRKLRGWAVKASREMTVSTNPTESLRPLHTSIENDIEVIFWVQRQLIQGYKPTQEEIGGDNAILEHAEAIDQYLKGYNCDQCIVVTNDAALCVRALALGFKAEGYESGTAKAPELFGATRVIESGLDYQPLFESSDPISDESVQIAHNEYAILRSPDENQILIKGSGSNGFVKTAFFERKGVYGIKPINLEQNFALDALLDPSIQIVALTGKAGTGKNLLTIAAALQQVIESSVYEKLIVTRTPISFGKELGYLPGTLGEKMAPWIRGVMDAVEFLHNINQTRTKKGRDPEYRAGEKVWQDLVELGKANIESPEHIRGASIAKTFFVLDEAQNLTVHEMKTFLSRMGEGSKIVLLGDPGQIDNSIVDIESNGLSVFIDRAKSSEAVRKLFAHVNLTVTERSLVAALTTELFA